MVCVKAKNPTPSCLLALQPSPAHRHVVLDGQAREGVQARDLCGRRNRRAHQKSPLLGRPPARVRTRAAAAIAHNSWSSLHSAEHVPAPHLVPHKLNASGAWLLLGHARRVRCWACRQRGCRAAPQAAVGCPVHGASLASQARRGRGGRVAGPPCSLAGCAAAHTAASPAPPVNAPQALRSQLALAEGAGEASSNARQRATRPTDRLN